MILSPRRPMPCRLKAGIGLRQPHGAAIAAARPEAGFLEVHAENYMSGGTSLAGLLALRRDYPVSVHGVGLSLGSAEGVDHAHLERFARLVERVEPMLVSDHLSWSVCSGAYFNDLLPLPLTREALSVVAGNLGRVQDRLKRRLLVENPSAYLRFVDADYAEAEFLTELVWRSGCGLLCDVNNIHVSCANLGGDPRDRLRRLPAGAVAEIHVAGHAVAERLLIDDHCSPPPPAVWTLYEEAAARFPQAATLVEWDANLPEVEVLLAQAREADRRRDRLFAGADDALAA
jgi:uncharacterized protein